MLASKEKRWEALTGGVGGTEAFLASLYIREAAAAGAELVTDFSARLQLGQQED